jgi:hypothetical protein
VGNLKETREQYLAKNEKQLQEYEWRGTEKREFL